MYIISSPDFLDVSLSHPVPHSLAVILRMSRHHDQKTLIQAETRSQGSFTFNFFTLERERSGIHGYAPVSKEDLKELQMRRIFTEVFVRLSDRTNSQSCSQRPKQGEIESYSSIARARGREGLGGVTDERVGGGRGSRGEGRGGKVELSRHERLGG